MNNRIVAWARTSPARHGLALASTVMALGGMILLGGLAAEARPRGSLAAPASTSSGTFTGPGLTGSLTLGQSLVQAGLNPEGHFFAEVKLRATADDRAKARSPLSMVVAIDTSGSMSGPKIEEARVAVTRLLKDMRDDDEITLVRFASDAEVLRPSGRLGDRVNLNANDGPHEAQADARGDAETVRASLLRQVAALREGGGTAIPQALTKSLEALGHAPSDRVRRVVLASDGLDGGRVNSTALARQAATRGLVVSALGIGLDFDEAYLGDVARVGGGNFAFIRGGDDLAVFLKKELDEGSMTSVQAAEVTLTLPAGVHLVQAFGAEAKTSGSTVSLQVGSLFAGDERRVIVELASSLNDGERALLDATAGWDHVGHGHERGSLGQVAITGAVSPERVSASVNPDVLASVVSVTTSSRQMAAVEAYNRGDQVAAQRLIAQNLAELDSARAVAPAPLASALASQRASFESTGQGFQSSTPGSSTGKVHAKKAAQSNLSNLSRSQKF